MVMIPPDRMPPAPPTPEVLAALLRLPALRSAAERAAGCRDPEQLRDALRSVRTFLMQAEQQLGGAAALRPTKSAPARSQATKPPDNNPAPLADIVARLDGHFAGNAANYGVQGSIASAAWVEFQASLAGLMRGAFKTARTSGEPADAGEFQTSLRSILLQLEQATSAIAAEASSPSQAPQS